MNKIILIILVIVAIASLMLLSNGQSKQFKHHKFDPTKSYKLYYVRLKTEQGIFYKIGYTTMRSVRARFRYSGDAHLIDKVLLFEKRQDAMQEERRLHRKYSGYRAYRRGRSDRDGPLYGNGQSELYRKDVLGLDDYREDSTWVWLFNFLRNLVGN